MRLRLAPGTVGRVVPLLLVVAVATALARPAHAGRTHYGWLYGSEVSPERGVELETWILERNGRPVEIGPGTEVETEETSVWWAPVIGVTEHVELAIPIELVWDDFGGQRPSTTQLARWGAEVRVRPHPSDRIEAGPVTTLLRAGVKRVVAARKGVRGEADAVIAFEQGRVHAEIDAGVVVTRTEDETVAEVRPGAGLSVRIVGELRLGAESYGEIGVSGDFDDWLVAGPSVGWTHGRFWLAGTFGIGIFGVETAPRLNFAVAF